MIVPREIGGYQVPASLQQLFDDAIASARQNNVSKFRGLYVDYTDAGALLEPDCWATLKMPTVAALTVPMSENWVAPLRGSQRGGLR
ncbi:hypothetical protein ABZT48_29590 [Streptomyces avermitilis]|uniref:hypothetical protein n=1 Tax=Streptomyces avermitilis TaxID=33903 RepID=UPI0033BD318C